MMRKNFLVIFSIALSISLLAASCSSSKSNEIVDNDSLAAAATVGDSSGLSAAARLIAEGILDADGDRVFAQITKDCQSKLSRNEISKQLRTVRSYLTTFLGASLDDFSVTKVETRRVLKDKTGQARYTIEVKGKSKDALSNALDKNSKQPAAGESSTSSTSPGLARRDFSFDEPTEWFDFVYESSTWKLDSCQEFLESAGVLTNSAATTSTTAP